MVRENKVKQKLKNGEAVIGTFVKTVDPSVIEILGCSGMEFFVIDSEHVSYNPETITDLVRASDLTGIVPIVRVREATAVNIMQALDTGALGYHAPNVDTPEQARIAVDAGRYTPLGNRGFAPSFRYSSAIPYPIPFVPPVIMATLFSSFILYPLLILCVQINHSWIMVSGAWMSYSFLSSASSS